MCDLNIVVTKRQWEQAQKVSVVWLCLWGWLVLENAGFWLMVYGVVYSHLIWFSLCGSGSYLVGNTFPVPFFKWCVSCGFCICWHVSLSPQAWVSGSNADVVIAKGPGYAPLSPRDILLGSCPWLYRADSIGWGLHSSATVQKLFKSGLDFLL